MRDALAVLDDLTARGLDALPRLAETAPPLLRLLLRRYAMTSRDDLEAALGSPLARALDLGAADADHERQSAWLELFVDAASLSRDARVLEAAAALAPRLLTQVSAADGWTVAGAMRAIHACLRAAGLVTQSEASSALVSVSVEVLEHLIGALYQPGKGMPHLVGSPIRAPGTLSDQVHAASALLSAHAWTDRLPYSMLAEELVQLARRSCWPADADREHWRSDEFIAGCDAASVLCRLAAIHADPGYQQAAVVAPESDYASDAAALLQALGDASHRHDIAVAAQFGLALCDWLSLDA